MQCNAMQCNAMQCNAMQCAVAVVRAADLACRQSRYRVALKDLSPPLSSSHPPAVTCRTRTAGLGYGNEMYRSRPWRRSRGWAGRTRSRRRAAACSPAAASPRKTRHHRQNHERRNRSNAPLVGRRVRKKGPQTQAERRETRKPVATQSRRRARARRQHARAVVLPKRHGAWRIPPSVSPPATRRGGGALKHRAAAPPRPPAECDTMPPHDDTTPR